MNSIWKIKIIVFLLLFQSCDFCTMMGSQKIGKNLYLLEGDCREDRIIVFNNQIKGCVTGGIFILPVYERHMDSKGYYAEFVDEVMFDNRWIIVKTSRIQENENLFWVIDKNYELELGHCESTRCDSLVFKYISGPFDFEEFEIQTNKLNINLEFN